ncbi:kinase/pyrophosphorylase, partial [Staphylococcus warneri]|uniref:kinase/pyrophosphorylase n=1 Tax=Staphylococcus warneri TaxID=1292 RepID=UPI0021BD6470
MYLPNKRYKIPNIPLLPQLTIPQTLFQHKPLNLFPLTATPNYIPNITKNPPQPLGISKSAAYNSLHRSKKGLS